MDPRGAAEDPLLVDAAWLAAHLRDPDLRVLDARWFYDHDRGRAASGLAAYRAGHVPGAAFVDLGEASAWPLPAAAAFGGAMRRAGVGRVTRVVVHDHGHFAAARLWWLLRYFGHLAAAVLDGGLPAWRGPLATGIESPPAGDFVAVPDGRMTVDHEDVREPGLVVLDARRPDLFRGEREPKYPRAGHIPGARSAHWRDNLGPDGRFRSPAELRRHYRALGVRAGPEVVACCGSGTSACHDLLALEAAGLGGGRLYAGSWRDWSSRPEVPVETG